MREKTLKFLGLMRRANALQVGENNTGEAVRAGKAKLLLLASDASENAKKRAESFVGGRSCLLLPLPIDLAKTPEGARRYADAAEEVARRFSKAERRKSETAKERTKRNGKRRTNV